jgi:hypothetical protein
MKTLEDLVPGIIVLSRDYPHVAKNIVDFWGTSYFNDYMEKLFSTNRNDRAGFSFAALMELQKVLDAHLERFPHYKRVYTAWI